MKISLESNDSLYLSQLKSKKHLREKYKITDVMVKLDLILLSLKILIKISTYSLTSHPLKLEAV